MPKRLVCTHPFAGNLPGDEEIFSNIQAAQLLATKMGSYQCFELRQDLGPDEVDKLAPEGEILSEAELKARVDAAAVEAAEANAKATEEAAAKAKTQAAADEAAAKVDSKKKATDK